MQEPGKILVSMTSYPGRIKNVGISIFLLLEQQTLPPDEVHLWLAEPQFPNKEADLPEDLQKVIKHPKVKLHWLPENTYVHKRHEIFKTAAKGSLVFLIDDDVMYSPDLIEKVVERHMKWPDAIVCYNRYHEHKYSGKRILYTGHPKDDGRYVNRFRWCGQSMIPTDVYPIEILDSEHQEVRDRCSPISDECWFQPWIVFNRIPITYMNYDWGTDIDPRNGKDKGIVSFSHRKDANGLEKRDNWLGSVLDAYPEIKQVYEKELGYEK